MHPFFEGLPTVRMVRLTECFTSKTGDNSLAAYLVTYRVGGWVVINVSHGVCSVAASTY